MPEMTKRDWLLLLLDEQPLDRVRLMKGLFLVWHRSGRRIEGYYEFIPYRYGPCSFELYTELNAAGRDRMIAQAPHPISNWAPYFLTDRGREAARDARRKADSRSLRLIESAARDVASVGFFDLLRKVYAEAPDFASESEAAKYLS